MLRFVVCRLEREKSFAPFWWTVFIYEETVSCNVRSAALRQSVGVDWPSISASQRALDAQPHHLGTDPEPAQVMRQLARARIEVTVAQPLVLEHHRIASGVRAACAANSSGEVMRMWNSMANASRSSNRRYPASESVF